VTILLFGLVVARAQGDDLAPFRPLSVSAAVHAEDDPTLEERFDDLEKQLADQQQEIDKLSSGLENVVFPGHSQAAMKVVGRVQMSYWTFPETDPGVNLIETGDPNVSPQDQIGFRRLRFGVRGELPSNMEYRVEMEWSGGNLVEFRDAWLGWNDLPVFQKLLIGNQKRPYGLDAWNSARYNVFIERPFTIDATNADIRRFGIQSWAHTDDLVYNWQFGVFNQRNIQDEGVSISDHLQPEYAGRFASTWWYDETSNGRGYGHWAIAGTLAHPDGSAGADPDPLGSSRAQNEARFRARPEARSAQRWLDTERINGADWYKMAGLEGVLNVGSVQLVAEYQGLWLQREAGAGDDLFFHGGYAYVSYFLTGEHMPWERTSGQLGKPVPFENFFLVDRCRGGGVGGGWGAWQTAVRYSYGDFSDQNILGGAGESVTLGLNWWWTDCARMQFNYIVGRIDDHRLDADNPASPIVQGDYQALGTTVMCDF
jgi:phosphate-selective porin OprO/OprP